MAKKAATTEKAESKPQNAKKSEVVQVMKVTAKSGLNLRKDAGMRYGILTVLTTNAEVIWTGEVKESDNKKWYKVEHRGITGYAGTNWLKKG